MAAKRRTSATFAVGQGFVGFALVAIGTTATLATLLGFFGSSWWLFDFAANYRPHLAVLLLLVALAYSLLFSRATGLFFMAMAIINGLVVLPLYVGNPAQAAEGDSLTIVSFNVGQRVSIRDAAFSWVDMTEPDIVVLVDSTDEWARSTELAAPYIFLNDMPVDRTYGVSVLAREDLEAEVIRVSQVRDVVVRVEASIGEQPVAIYAVQSRTSRNQSDADLRRQYFEEVSVLVERETIPAVVVGDFQSSSWSHTFRNLLAETGLVDSQTGFGIQTTWPADSWPFVRLPFDHLVHSETLTTVDRHLGPTFGVEHRPIVVTLAIAA